MSHRLTQRIQVLRRRPWWPWLTRGLTLAFLGAVATLIAVKARDIDWDQVLVSLRGYRGPTLWLAAAASVASALVYCGYDLIGRAYARHAVPVRRTMAIAFVSYAFNLNLGAMIGGVGFRYRLYSRAGLRNRTIGQVLALSLTTNWLGFFALAGLVWGLRLMPVPAYVPLSALGVQLIGLALWTPVLWYLWRCASPQRRSLRAGRFSVRLPHLPMGLLQVALSMLNWLLMAAVPYLFLREHVPFPAVVGAILVNAVGGLITHVPGGIGVMEVIFIAILGRVVPHSHIIAALLAYRAVYYLAPLLVASALYLWLEIGGRRQPPLTEVAAKPAAPRATRPPPRRARREERPSVAR
ncbi:MAG TPA: lysylphosphatidylglycerol synthase domain-containing protein [Candidatus Binatia bacterium]|nr:lysylphosphatidylglycerol synthase domain-containing protein [Candidatus Binatia bacterium]